MKCERKVVPAQTDNEKIGELSGYVNSYFFLNVNNLVSSYCLLLYLELIVCLFALITVC